MKISEIEKLKDSIYGIPYDLSAFDVIEKTLDKLASFVKQNHFIKNLQYLEEIQTIRDKSENISKKGESTEDRKLQENIKRDMANLTRNILDENKKIFIVHGRNIGMRDRLSSFIGKLKLNYVIFEHEGNNGSPTLIEKFLQISEDCRYAIVLFSADDVGNFNEANATPKKRVRQNVILELGFFLSKVGRKNIIILHEPVDIEKPSDFDGIVYEAFDDSGAWKSKLVKEMRNSKIYIEQGLVDRA